MNKRWFNNPEYNKFSSSCEILMACEHLGGDNILDLGGNSYKVWADPSPLDCKKVESLAWNYADVDEEVLFWGINKIKKPDSM